jgi:hypothetical protein
MSTSRFPQQVSADSNIRDLTCDLPEREHLHDDPEIIVFSLQLLAIS